MGKSIQLIVTTMFVYGCSVHNVTTEFILIRVFKEIGFNFFQF